MSGKKLMFVGLAIVVALSSLFMVACGGGGDDAKKAMETALVKIQGDIDGLTAQMMTGGTAADIKAGQAAIEPDWVAVVDAAKNLEGADAAKAQQVWDDVTAAIGTLADDADLATLAATVMGPFNALQAHIDELAELIGLDLSTATTAPAAGEPTTTVAQ